MSVTRHSDRKVTIRRRHGCVQFPASVMRNAPHRSRICLSCPDRAVDVHARQSICMKADEATHNALLTILADGNCPVGRFAPDGAP